MNKLIAGIDGGSTNTKVAFKRPDGDVEFYSTSTTSIEKIIHNMREAKIGAVRCIGTSIPNEFPFERLPIEYDDPIKAETYYQAKGAVWLVKRHNGEKIRNCLVVSIGTGTSYTRYLFGRTFRIPLGNALGGGFLNGMRRWLNIDDWDEFNSRTRYGHPKDILVKDVIPTHPLGNLVLSSCGNLNNSYSKDDVCTSLVKMVATAIAKDVVPYSMLTRKVIFVGNTTNLTKIKTFLSHYSRYINKRFYFPKDREYAGAVGAWLG
jgi:pantothenate kinase